MTDYVTDVKYLPEGRLVFKFGSMQFELDACEATVRVSDGELGDKSYAFRSDHVDEIDKFARWFMNREEEDDEDPKIDPLTPNEFEVMVNLGDGLRRNILSYNTVLGQEGTDPNLWAFMAHNLLRFATHKMGQLVNQDQAPQPPTLPGVLPFPGLH